jgi:hypothetical protein
MTTKTPKMTRVHFQFIADIINEMPSHAPSLRSQKESVANKFARELKRTNPAFREGTFLEACGMEFVNGGAVCKGYADTF